MTEPIYEFVKGKGWVATRPKRDFPYYNYDLLCNNCGLRAGSHSAGQNRFCPDQDGNLAPYNRGSWA